MFGLLCGHGNKLILPCARKTSRDEGLCHSDSFILQVTCFSSLKCSPGNFTLVHKGNMCESACGPLKFSVSFYRAWPLKGQFLCKQLCVPVLKADRKVQNRVVRGVGQLGRDGGFNRQSSLKVYKS